MVPAAVTREPSTAVAGSGRSLGGPRIVVIDDDPEVRDGVARLLSLSGGEVLTAPRADEALTLLPERRWDLAMVDLAMPEMSGPQLARELRAVDPHLELVLLADSMADGQVQPLRDPVDLVLTKPLTMQDLIRLGELQRRGTPPG